LEDPDLDHDDECGYAEPKYRHEEYSGELNAEEWISWKAAKSTIESAGFAATLRIAVLSCSNCDASIYRLKARATTSVGGLTVWKEYAVE
jgi:N-acetylmuramoyl-L-alanine amidase CwlA